MTTSINLTPPLVPDPAKLDSSEEKKNISTQAVGIRQRLDYLPDVSLDVSEQDGSAQNPLRFRAEEMS